MDSKKIKLGVPREEGQLSMLFARGGPREGAGRKAIGETRKVSLTLPAAAWAALEERCARQSSSKSELLRALILEGLHPDETPKSGKD